MDPGSKFSSHVATALSVCVLSVFSIAVIGTLFNFERRSEFKFPSNNRSPASSFNFPTGLKRVDLSGSWKYAVVPNSKDPRQVSEDPSLIWKPFNVERSWEHADDIEGHYWLRFDFHWSPATNFLKHPSIVLGIVSHYHRAFLNENFIGGSNYFGTIAQYNLDPSILNESNNNTLLIKAYTDRTLLPGITRISGVGSFLGEFSDVEKVIWQNNIRFHVYNLIYLVVTLLTAFLSGTFFLFYRKNKEYLYYSVYLFLGALSLFYYNAYVMISLDFQFYRFLKIFSLGLSSFVLFSTLCHLLNKARIHFWNNLAAITFALCAALLLLPASLDATAFSSRYALLFRVMTLYTVAWLAYTAFVFVRNVMANVTSRQFSQKQLVSLVLLFSGVLTGFMCFSSGWFGFTAGTDITAFFTRVGTLHSFIFGIFVVGLTAYNQAYSVGRLDKEQARNELVVDTVRTLRHSQDLESTVSVIQERFCQFVGCERSTIYLVEHTDGQSMLAATYLFGEKKHEAIIRRHLKPDEGLIGQVVKSRSGLLIKDLTKSPHRGSGRTSYKTNSCMLHPLIIEGELIGVFTLADKNNGKPFTDEDFEIISTATTDLSFIIQNAKLRSRLSQQVQGIILTLTKVIEKRDPYTEFHSQGVRWLAEQICKKISYPVTNELQIAALLHDIGKIFVPRRILNKPGRLTDEERQIIEKHSRWSKEVLQNIPGFEKIGEWAGLHHETTDGKGYPYGLTEDLIPIEAQIISVADFIDALSTNRSYRPKFPFEKVEAILKDMADKNKFNKKLAAAGVATLNDPAFRKLYSEKSESYRPQHNQEHAAVLYYNEILADLLRYMREFGQVLSKQPTVPKDVLDNLENYFTSVEQELIVLRENLKQIKGQDAA